GYDRRRRWRLVGNAVTVPIAEWLARQIKQPRDSKWCWDEKFSLREGWPSAAWGFEGKRFKVEGLEVPVGYEGKDLYSFLRFDGRPLSSRAARGVLTRLRNSTLDVRRTFLRDLDRHVKRMTREENGA